MVAEFVALATVILTAAAEYVHGRRVRRLAALAFGPGRKPALWTRPAPLLRVVASAALAWGLTTLLLLTPKVHKSGVIPESEYRDLLLVLDVSPSMRLQDAGPDGKQTRRKSQSVMERLTRREYALMACAFGAAVLALLPLFLHLFGTSWKPGIPTRQRDDERKKTTKLNRLSPIETT